MKHVLCMDTGGGSDDYIENTTVLRNLRSWQELVIRMMESNLLGPIEGDIGCDGYDFRFLSDDDVDRVEEAFCMAIERSEDARMEAYKVTDPLKYAEDNLSFQQVCDVLGDAIRIDAIVIYNLHMKEETLISGWRVA